MAEQIKSKSDPSTNAQFKVRAFLLLAHLLYHKHSFVSIYKGNWIKISPTHMLNVMLKMKARDMQRKLIFLMTKGYIVDYKIPKKGTLFVQLAPPSLWQELQEATVDPIFEEEKPKPAVPKSRPMPLTWNPKTLRFD